MLVDSLEVITSGSFIRILDVSNDGPPRGSLLGASLEEAGWGSDSWGLF